MPKNTKYSISLVYKSEILRVVKRRIVFYIFGWGKPRIVQFQTAPDLPKTHLPRIVQKMLSTPDRPIHSAPLRPKMVSQRHIVQTKKKQRRFVQSFYAQNQGWGCGGGRRRRFTFSEIRKRRKR